MRLSASSSGTFPPIDALGKSLDDRRLANTRFAQQNGIVLGAAAENLNGPLNFTLAADDRIELVLFGKFGEVTAETVQGRRLRLAALRRRSPSDDIDFASTTVAFATFQTVTEQVQHFFADLFQLEAQIHQDLGCHAFLLAQQPQQDVLGAHVVVVQVACLFHRILDDLLGTRRLRQLAHRDHFWSALDQLLDFQANLAEIDVQVLQHVGGDAAAFFDQSQQDVLGADILVVESLRLLVRQLHHLSGSIGKSFVHL